jgi:hypothetical protein
MNNILELKKILEEDNYNKFLEETRLNKFIIYPVFLYRDFFLSNSVLGLIKNKDEKIYNLCKENIEKHNILEIKID